VVANIICEYAVELIEGKSCEVVLDAYLPNKETKNKYRDAEVFSVLYSGNREVVLELNSDRDSLGLSDAKEILAIDAEVRSSSASFVKGGCEFKGELIISGVACETNADGSIGYLPFKLQSPFSEIVNINYQIPQGALLEYAVSPIDVEPIFDFENLNFKTGICIKIYLILPTKFSRLYSSESVEGSFFERDESKITVYYPKTGENLFEIAKIHHTTPGKIAMDNKLSEGAISSVNTSDSLVGIKKLLIF
jgi:hypothetical protein